MKSDQATGKGTKLDALTGLRFLAAALILAHHSRALRIPLPDYAFGQGVTLFFVLSGFILSYVYPKLGDWHSARRFLALRVARIWPAHVATLAAAVGLFLLPLDGTLLANLFLVQSLIPAMPWYFSGNAVSWSLSTELFFYLAFPLLIWNWGRTFWWKWIAAASLILLLCYVIRAANIPETPTGDDVVTAHGLLYINPLARIFEFITGMVAYSCFSWLYPRIETMRKENPRRVFLIATIVEFAVLVLVLYCLANYAVINFLGEHFNLTTSRGWWKHTDDIIVFPFLIIILAIGAGAISKILSTRLAIILGELSFSIYLLHLIVFKFYARHWMPSGVEPDYRGLALCILVTFVLSFLLWRLIEVPCRMWAKRRLSKPERSDPATAVKAFIPNYIRDKSHVRE